jgi:Xaa-Pro aminopeptidase
MTFSQRLPPEVIRRIQRTVCDGLVEADLDVLVTDDPEDVAYLTGFFHFPCERPVALWLDREGMATLLVPRLEREHAKAQNTAADLVVYPEFPGTRPPFDILAAAHLVPPVRVGVPASMTLGRLNALQAAFPTAKLTQTELVTRTRLCKHPEELDLHREAGRITDLMLTEGRRMIEDAVSAGHELPTEAELASHVSAVGSVTMYDEHTDVVVRSPLAGGLVYAGANSAQPHALPSGYRMRVGDSFVLSLGCAVGGRYVEGERTFVLGEPTARQRQLYETVLAAQQRGAELLRPGAVCSEVNKACLKVIRAAGLGEHLLHRQGHGIGLGMHEPPWLEDGDHTTLDACMVVSDEPGLYVTGEAGFRISDSMVVTGTGAEPLTHYPRRLDDVVIAA